MHSKNIPCFTLVQGKHVVKCPTGCACVFALTAPGAAITPDTSQDWASLCECVCVFVVPWKLKQVQLQQLEWRLDLLPAPRYRCTALPLHSSDIDRRGKLRYQRRFTVLANPFRTLCKSAQWHLLSAKCRYEREKGKNERATILQQP